MSSAETETESAVEPTVDTAAESTAPVRRRPAAKRPAKLDALLAAAVDRARQGVLEMAPAEQVGDHVGVVAEAERLMRDIGFTSKVFASDEVLGLRLLSLHNVHFLTAIMRRLRVATRTEAALREIQACKQQPRGR